MRRYFQTLLLLFTIGFCLQFNEPVEAATTLHLEIVDSTLNAPVFLTAPANDSRLFIVEQPGRIMIHLDGTKLPTPFLNITSSVVYGSERGLLGLAFHPDYANNGYFYVNYTTLIFNQTYSRICRFQVDSVNQNIADLSSEVLILQLQQPFNNHNGGMLAFGPDGYLYAGFGDGGGGGDPNNRSQNGGNLFGTILRLDIDGTFPYTIPADNPFVNDSTMLDEIWAYGLRNPWRFSFDRLIGDLYIGDVGQDSIEEIDMQLSTSNGGENYGWRLKEGSACYNPSTNCEAGVTLTEPFYDYTHLSTIPRNCSVIGGYVYRGSCLPEFNGMYFFADYCSRKIWSIRNDNGSVVDSTEYSPTIPMFQMASFSEDANGELYIIDLSGIIYRIVPEGGSAQCATVECCEGMRGNIDNSNEPEGSNVDISDLVYYVAFSFGNPSGPAPVCMKEADVDGNEILDISDIVYMVSYMFGAPSGPAPVACT